MNARKVFLPLSLTCLMVLLLVCCNKPQPVQEDPFYTTPSRAAEYFYTSLMEDRYPDCLEVMARDTVPEDLHQETLDMLAEYASQMKTNKEGLQAVEVISEEALSDSLAQVLMSFTYGDGTSERVLVPMICRNQRWALQ